MRSNYWEQRIGFTEKIKKNWKIKRGSKAKLQLWVIEKKLKLKLKFKSLVVSYYWKKQSYDWEWEKRKLKM